MALCTKHTIVKDQKQVGELLSQISDKEKENIMLFKDKANLEIQKVKAQIAVDDQLQPIINEITSQKNDLTSKEASIKAKINAIMSNSPFQMCQVCQKSFYLHEAPNQRDITNLVQKSKSRQDIQNYLNTNSIKFSCGQRMDALLLRCEFCKDVRNYNGCGSDGSDKCMFCIGSSTDFEKIKTHRHVYFICPKYLEIYNEYKTVDADLKETEEGFSLIEQEKKNMSEGFNKDFDEKIKKKETGLEIVEKSIKKMEKETEELNIKIDQKIKKQKEKEMEVSELYDDVENCFSEILGMIGTTKTGDEIAKYLTELKSFI